MKLLLDENISQRLVELLAPNFPGSNHIERLGMRGAADAEVWDYVTKRAMMESLNRLTPLPLN